jgi:hypothetical protein
MRGREGGMASVVPLPAQLNSLQELQRSFCLFKLAGEIWVGDLNALHAWQSGGGKEVALMYRRPAGELLIKRHLETLPIASDPRDTLQKFFVSPGTHVFDQLAFSPLPTPPDTCNLWVGPQVQPKGGDWQTIKAFLLEVICDGNIVLFRYLMLFLAHMLQCPGEKSGIMIVMLGGQGTGKGTLFQILKAVWSQTTLLVSDIDNVIGRFNAAIERNFVLCMDEALFAGDKKAMDRLKSLVTEPTITIEEKHQPRRSICSFHRFFAASNHAHFAAVDADDRRFVFFQVSEARKGDHQFWDQLHLAIADHACVAAMVHELLSYDLTKFQVRQKPNTAAHTDQKLRSLSGFERYWFEVLQTGEFEPGSAFSAAKPWSVAGTQPHFVSSNKLMSGWKAYEGAARQFSPKQERDMRKALASLCPSVVATRRKQDGGQQRGYDLPLLPVARAEFAKFIGAEVDWMGCSA